MDAWIPVTIAAAFSQNLRFMLQKQLGLSGLSAAAATWARFVFAAPVALVLAALYGSVRDLAAPALGLRFWGFAVMGGTAQILATICVLALFTRGNFAVGVTLKKTEVLMAVGVGFLLLGEGVTWLGGGAILLGLVGVLVLTEERGLTGVRRFLTPAAGLGLASGLLFAVSGVGYRGASLTLGEGDALFRALVTLACVTSFQALLMAAWFTVTDRSQMSATFRAWRISGLVGLTSLIGSACWFTAFALQTVAYVKALGQVEILFSVLTSILVFRERVTARAILGMAVLLASILVLVLVV